MADALKGKKIAFLMANEGVEQVELTRPWEAARTAGAQVEIVAPESGEVQGFHHLDRGDTFPVDRTIASVNPDDYDGVMLPGGVANPDRLRMDEHAVTFLQKMATAGKPIAAICHAPWMLVEAGVIEGRRLTSWPSLRTDITNAGGTWVDEEVVVDGTLVTSRKPDDLDAFCRQMVTLFAS